MAHNTRLRADVTAWATGTVVTSDEFDSIDAAQASAINGDDGGEWHPLAQVVIGGAGMSLAAPVSFETGVTATVQNAAAIQFNPGSSIRLMAGAGFLGNNLSTFSLSDGCLATVATPIIFSGSARIRRRLGYGGTVNATYTIAAGEIVVIDSTALVGNITYTLSGSGAQDGDEIEFVITGWSNTYNVVVDDGSGHPLTMNALTSGTFRSLRFLRCSPSGIAQWAVSRGVNP